MFSSQTTSFLQEFGFWKWPFLYPFFRGLHELDRNGAHCCFTTKKTLKPQFFCRNLVFVAKTTKQGCLWLVKTKKLLGHIGVFLWKMVCLKSKIGDVWKPLFSAGLRGIARDLLTLSFFCWFSVFWFLLSWFLIRVLGICFVFRATSLGPKPSFFFWGGVQKNKTSFSP